MENIKVNFTGSVDISYTHKEVVIRINETVVFHGQVVDDYLYVNYPREEKTTQ